MPNPKPTLPVDLVATVNGALAEDVGSGDITAQLIPAAAQASAKIVCREQAILCGNAWVNATFKAVDPNIQLSWLLEEGEIIKAGQTVAKIDGLARSLLTAERTALNFLQTLSATATASRHYAELVSHTNVKLLDTRKTLPGLRTAQKYAVRIGGCFNHRMGLFDAYLIKENHIAACDGISAAIERARTLKSGVSVEIEVQNLDQLEQALRAGADIVMLDNFSLPELIEAVAQNKGRAKLEASGSIDSSTLVKVAETGVDYISIGSLTKHCKATDYSLLLG